MNVIRKFRDPRHFAFAAIVALGLGALLFSACENPFRAGLGTIVDLHYPTVNLVSPAPGSPIRGEQEFTGIAWDDMSLEFVHFMITPGPDYDDLGGMLREGYTLQDLEDRQLLGWQDVNHLSSGRNRYGNWDWNRTIDTRLFRDGPLNIRLRVRDTAGNEVETRDDIVFFIRNNPPVISMDFPRIVQGEDPGQLGSEHLNFNFASDFSRLLHRVDPLIGVSGMITDENGLAMPPQFRIWEIINPDPDAVRRDPISGIRQLRHDELPGPDYGWQPIGGDEHNRSTYFLPVPTPNPGSLLFFYTFPLPDAQGRFFAMQVRAQSNVRGDGGNYETLFPRDEWTEYQWYRLTPEQRIENSFVAFLLESPQEPPQLELLRFQDILRQDAWDPNLDDRQGDYRDIEIDPNEAHYFLTETVNVKRGSFTLRVRASHLEEVSEAVAFWDDGVERGLFIWDTATEHWNSDSNVDAQTNHFTRWGYADPNRRTPPTRNFIFTYQDDAEHDFHADDVHDSASGRYRIQRFRGDNWNVLYRNIHEPGGWDALLNSVNWENAEDFWSNREEITIRVYARAELGRVSQVPLITTLAIDREPPTVALSRIDGSAGERLDEATGQMLHIVNGVIRVMLSVDDAGSGLRNFIRPDGSQGDEEIMFVLMGENYALSDDVDFWSLDKTSLDGLFAYGSAVDRNMMMRTSRTHAYEDDDDLLEDGRYWLYVFARDRAFNVGRERFLLEVDAESDLPRFYFDMGINPAVTNPSVSADGTPAGFYVDGSTRNRLRPADNITFTIRDDDSLDLGTTSGEPSTLRVSIVGSSMDATTGEIRPLDFDDPDNDLGFRLYLSDAQIKSAFPPQSVIAGNRVPVREWMGTVTQGMFLELLRDSGLYDNLLRDHPTYATNLPDGIFRINMEVRDDPSNKLAMPMPEGGYETADAAMSHSVGFWIAVDERRPVFSNDIEPPDGSFISARDDEFITGTVSDQNGPISVVSFNVRNTAPGGTTYNAGTQRVRLTPRGNGVYGFSATISMSEFFPQLMSGEFVFYLTVEDRFGNRETLRRIHIMDNTPPTVTLRPSMGITTFERPSAANRILADSVGIIGGGNNDLNASRLANMVLNFAVDAADDFAVAGIHWWLLPANAGVVDGGVISMPSGGTVASFWSFPAREANPQVAMGTRGAFGRIAAASGEAFIDTFGLNLPDGEYRLHVIAVDEAGNESVDVVDVTGHMQTIFLFQAEDRPYFTPGISPAGSEVRGDDLVVTGIITDDDGFGTGMFPDSGSIEIWISTVNNLADGVELDGEALRRANWHRAVPTQGLSLIDGTNLALEVNLLELDWSPPFTFGEGEKYYVIRAQDSHVNKLSPTGGPASSTDRVAAYSQVFRFIRDVQPPELVLTHPQPGQIFGDVTLYLVGTVSDANLSVHDGNPYLLWRLNGIGGLTRFPLTAGYITGRGMQGGIETVSFRIPHARIFGDRIIDGPNTLELRVEDKTGASDELSRGFIRDTLPPEVGVRTYITTFERASAADRIPGINGSVGIISSADLNATRLANKVLDFAVDATDNIAVGGIHWWLLPADVGVNQTELISGNGTVASFWAFPARESNPQAALGTRGAFGRIAAPGGSAFIDTAGLNLPDGEYRLHVIALDSAGNESVGLSHVQTIFLFQAEDRPYFASGISPDGGEVRGDDLVVTGIITDDDGFGAGMFPEEESVQVWISANNNLNLAAGEKPNSAMLGSAGWHSANVPTESGRGLTLIDGTNLVLNIDLQELDWSPSFTFGDGDKHFVIRAQDSAANKLSSAGGPAASTDRVASYSRVFHFIRDTLPPELYLESPIPGQIVPNEGFNLVGFIADANLSRHNFGTPANPDYRRYLLWRLGGTGSLARFALREYTEITRPNGITEVHFNIPHTSIFGDLGDGNHSLELRVEDMTGASYELSRSFIKDRTPPEVGARTLITTFERPSSAYRIPADSVGIISSADLNATRLANKVLGFAVDATDNIAVGGIHWWLLPADVGAGEAGLIEGMSGGGTVASFWSYPARATTPQAALGTRGAFGIITAPGGSAFIDTAGLNLPDGEYRLHVIAVDGAGNESVGLSHVQTIFLFQAEDRPYFATGISPDGGEVRGDDLVVTGIITDDDGFGAGMFPEEESVQIWISASDNLNLAAGEKPNSAMLGSAGWHSANVPTESGRGLTLIDGTSLVLDINLQGLDWSPPFAFGQGDKHFVIRTQDSAANKLSPAGGPAPSTDRVASYSRVFHFVRDTLPPELELTQPEPGQMIGNEGFNITGFIADANLTMYNGNPYLLWRLNGLGRLERFPLTAGYITERGMQGGIETVSFRIPHASIFGDVIIDGSNTLELRVEDKTGAFAELSRSFIRDTLPPEVGIRTLITTFERSSAAYRIPADSVGIISSVDLNATRLANKVISFAVDATDNVAVGGIHWWLLPADVGASEAGLTEGVSGGGTVASFLSFPAGESNPQAALGRRGAFGRISAPGGEAFIDTYGLDLPDGEYRLHVIAVDAAGNESVGLSHVQTIFLFQAEDRPYFATGISPANGEVRGDDLVVTGIITDDDGFGAGMFPEHGSVQVWISTNDNLDLAAGEEPNSAMLGSAGWHSANVPIGPGDGLTLIDGTSLVLDINLLDLFPAFFAEAGDGGKYFVIRAQDSAANKLSPAGGPAATTDRVASYSRVFHFVRDTLPPELYLESPVSGQIFGNEGFNLVGFIADANLSMHDFGTAAAPDYRRYLSWRLGGTGGLARFALREYTEITRSNGITEVRFDIPHTSIFGDGITDGPHTLELRVEDKTGASAELSRSFIKDTLEPEVNVRTFIRTFERPSAAYRIPDINGSVGIISSADLNATRLANKVLGFAVDATDNVAVGGIHWWLLPADVGASVAGLTSDGMVDSFLSFPAGESDPQAALGRYGAFGRIAAPGGEAFIDTYGLDLPDGEYRLHVIAVDGAGNESVGLSHVQTIFLFQAEDRPYFATGISPSGGEVRGNDLVVTGIITDDDGFGAGMFPEDESVQVWISSNNNLNLAAGEKPNSAMLESVGGWHSAYVPTESGRGLTLIDGTSLVLDINLQVLFPTFFEDAGDGDKYFVIRAQDSAANKLSPTGVPADDTDRVVSYSSVFHFVRDTLPPELDLESPVPGQVAGNAGFDLVGTISDANLSRYNFGTATAPDYRHYLLWRLNGVGNLARFALSEDDAVTRPDGITEVSFEIPHSSIFGNIDLEDGNHSLELRVEDMNGLFDELSISFIIDRTPPTVALRPGYDIATFSRPSAAYRIPANSVGIVGSAELNATRLANNVLRFAVDATDNTVVGDVHWWLLPADTGASATGLTDDGMVDSFSAFPAGEDDLQAAQAALGTRGAFGRIAAGSNGIAIIDTAGLELPNGEYRLHLIAVDQAGNESIDRDGVTSHVQTIFLFQAEDRPYFHQGIRPADGELLGQAIILTGVISDDDGFSAGMFPEYGSVQIWISSNDNLNLAAGEKPNSIMLENAGGWHSANVPLGPGQGLTLIDGTSLVLNIDLLNLFPAFFAETGDGYKYFVIRALDSAANKFAPNGYPAPSTDRVAGYSQVFSFMRDISPPVLVLTHPERDGQTVTSEGFALTGSIADANLSKIGGNPYLLWRLNGATGYGVVVDGWTRFQFQSTDIQLVDGLETVLFNIPGEVFGALLRLGINDDGINTLELRVTDRTGAVTELSRTFTIDDGSPTISLNIAEVPLRDDDANPISDEDFFAWWWTEPTTGDDAILAWNNQRREWAERHSVANPILPVIVPEGRIAWLSGSFTDEISDIDLNSARFYINNEPAARTYFRNEGPGRTVSWRIPLTDDGFATIASQPLPSGVYTVRIRVADVADNEYITGVYAFRLDADEPHSALDVTAQDPSVFGISTGETVFTISGTATDANLRDVRLSIYRDGAPVLGPIELVADYNNPDTRIGLEWRYNVSIPQDIGEPRIEPLQLGWSFDVPKEIFQDGSGWHQGLHEIRVTAMDWRGSESEITVWQFTKDTVQPIISFIGRDNSTTDSYDLGPGELIYGVPDSFVQRIATGNIQVGISDAHSDIFLMQGLLERWTWDGTEYDSPGSWNAVVLPMPLGAPVGSDVVGWANIAGFGGSPRNRSWAMPVGDLPEGLYRLRLRAMDSSYFAGHTPENFTDDSRGNHVTSDWLYFYRDVSPPIIEFRLEHLVMSSRFGTGPGGTGTQGELGFTVTAFDYTPDIAGTPGEGNSLGLRYINVRITRIENGQEYLVDETYVNVFEDKSYIQREFGLTLEVPYDAPDGIYTITIRAVDLAGRSSEVSDRFTLDNTPPDGSFHPAANLLRGDAWVISGEAVDDVGLVSRVDFRIGRLNGADPTAETLVSTYLATADEGTLARDTSRNNHIFAAGGLPAPANRTWYPLVMPGENVPTHHYFSVQSAEPFNWQLSVTNSYALVTHLLANSQMIDHEDHIILLPIWFRVVDNQENAGYFGGNIRINPDANIPSLIINTPSERIANIDYQRGGRVDFQGLAQIEANVPVHSVVYRVWVGGRAQVDPANPNAPVRDPDNVHRPGSSGNPGRATPVVEFAGARPVDPAVRNLLSGQGADGWLYTNIPSGLIGNNNVPWNFNLNAGTEIAALISTYGFNSTTGLPAVLSEINDTIRVFVEMLAINGFREVDDNVESVTLGTGVSSLQVVSFYLRSSAPSIVNARVIQGADDIRLYWDGNPQWEDGVLGSHRGRFTIEAVLDAASGQRLSDVRIALPNEVDANLRTALPVWGNPSAVNLEPGASRGNLRPGVTVVPRTDAGNPTVPAAHDGRFWTLTYVLDPALDIPIPADDDYDYEVGVDTIRDGGWRNTGGVFHVDIRIRDDATPRVETTLTLPISLDNFAPVVDIGHITNPTQAGLSGQFIGRVLDFETTPTADGPFDAPRGVNRIYAWFVRGEEFVAIDYRASGALAANGHSLDRVAIADAGANRREWTDVRFGRTASVSGTGGATTISVTNEGDSPSPPIISPAIPANAATDGGGAWVRVISGPRDATERGTGRRDAIFWDASGDGADVSWGLNIDTTRLPDGPLTLRYIVVDDTGNATFHEQHVVIMNNFPEISRVTLHTSNTGVPAVIGAGDVADGTRLDLDITPAQSGYIDSGFTVRNNFLGFTVETRSGNPPLRYSLHHVTRQRVNLDATTLADMFRNSTGVDMFTIAEAAGISDETWHRLGVHVNRTPVAGMHFAFRPVDTLGRSMDWGTSLTNAEATELANDFTLVVAAGSTPAIYRYTAHRSRDAMPLLTPPSVHGPGLDEFGFNLLVNPNFTAWPSEYGSTPAGWTAGHGFNFHGNVSFGGSVPSMPTGAPAPGMLIPQFITYPSILVDPDALQPADHPHRPFFLIRVWDDVIAGAHPSLEDIDRTERSNDRLHDAVVIAMDIFLHDTTPPKIGIHPLNPNFEREVSGNNLTPAALTSTIGYALAPVSYDVNVTRGGLFNTGTERDPRRSGHIEPRYLPGTVNTLSNGTQVPRDLVSGQIILRGYARDNQRIHSVDMAITLANAGPGTGDWVRILEWSDTTNDAWPQPGLRPAVSADNTIGLGEIALHETLDWLEGHDVEWAIRWNTEARSIGPADNVRISVRVRDHQGLPTYPVHTDGNSLVTQFNVNIVPYIIGFERQSRYANIRSMQGWHSFYQGETGISALGFNLGTVAPTVGGPIENPSAVGNRPALSSGLVLRGFTFSVPVNATSGRIDVTVPVQPGLTVATPIHNHLSHHARPWNREDFFGARSVLWTNRPHAHIWRTRADGNMPRTFMGLPGSSTNLDHPGMALQYTVNTAAGAVTATSTHPAGNLGTGMQLGTLHGVWSVYGNAMVHYGRNDGTGINPTADRTRISDGTPFDPILQPDIGLFRGGGIPNLVYIWHQDGNPTVRFHTRPDQRSGGDGTNPPTQELIAAGAAGTGVTERWRNIRTVTAAGNPGTLTPGGAGPNTASTTTNAATNPGRLFTTVYDALNRRLVFALRDGTAGVTTVFIDGNGANIGNTQGVTASVHNAVAASGDAGLFSAVGYDLNAAGLTLPIVAYYDFTHDTIRVAFANAQTPGTAGWRRDNVLTPRTIGGVTEAQHPLFIGSGRYVSMAVDRFGTIHLAFFNSRHQALVYAYAPRPATGHTGQSRTFNAMIVDTLPGVGTWTDISVDHWGNPFIVYGYQGRDDNFDGVRMAFRSGGRGPGHTVANAAGDPAGIAFGRPLNCRVTGASISGWEAVSMAAPFRVSYDRLNIEAWPPSNRANPTGATAVQMGATPAARGVWNAAIGYVGDRYFRIGYFFRPATITNGWLGNDQN